MDPRKISANVVLGLTAIGDGILGPLAAASFFCALITREEWAWLLVPFLLLCLGGIIALHVFKDRMVRGVKVSLVGELLLLLLPVFSGFPLFFGFLFFFDSLLMRGILF